MRINAIISVIVIGLLLLICSGCRSYTPLGEGETLDLKGEWRFIYYEASDCDFAGMPVPPFDSIAFLDGQRVAIRGNHEATASVYPYKVEGRTLSIAGLRMPGKRDVVVLKTDAYLADENRLLVLRDDGNGAVYLRSDFQLPMSEVAGVWSRVCENAKQYPEVMELGNDGSIKLKSNAFAGSYRVWAGEDGMTLSAFVVFPKRGARTLVWKVERKDLEHLSIEPFSANGEPSGHVMHWQRVRQDIRKKPMNPLELKRW